MHLIHTGSEGRKVFEVLQIEKKEGSGAGAERRAVADLSQVQAVFTGERTWTSQAVCVSIEAGGGRMSEKQGEEAGERSVSQAQGEIR